MPIIKSAGVLHFGSELRLGARNRRLIQWFIADRTVRGGSWQSRLGRAYCRSMPSARRFPPPWIAEETDACFIVKDATGQALAYFYFEDEPGRCAAAKLVTKDESAADKFTYMHDFRVPGMLHGRVVRPPTIGAKLEAVDDASVGSIAGAK